MPALIAPALISGGASIISGLIGSSAASKAAKQLNAEGQAVGTQIDKSTGQAVDAGYAGITQANGAVDAGTAAANQQIGTAGSTQKDIYGNMQAGLQPYQAAGTYGLDKMKSQGDFSFNPSNLENDPGYQFQLQQGMKALQSSAAARGMLQSGSAMKSMDNYSQGLAGTSYQNAYNRALSTFDTNRAGYQSLAGMGQTANAQNIQAGGIYGGQLTSLAGLGANVDMSGAGMKDNTAMQGNEYIGTTGLQGAEAAGNVRMQGAGAQAAGTMGAANAWGSALGGVANAANTYAMGQSMANGNVDGGMPAGSPAGVPGGIPVSAWSGGGAGAPPPIPTYPAASVAPWQQQGG